MTKLGVQGDRARHGTVTELGVQGDRARPGKYEPGKKRDSDE
jgi:hypothetical protein